MPLAYDEKAEVDAICRAIIKAEIAKAMPKAEKVPEPEEKEVDVWEPPADEINEAA